jgi:IS30 family transposase
MKRDIGGKTIAFKTIYRYIRQDKINGGTLYKLLPHRAYIPRVEIEKIIISG